jgi:hypothetical protein
MGLVYGAGLAEGSRVRRWLVTDVTSAPCVGVNLKFNGAYAWPFPAAADRRKPTGAGHHLAHACRRPKRSARPRSVATWDGREAKAEGQLAAGAQAPEERSDRASSSAEATTSAGESSYEVRHGAERSAGT